MKMKRFLSLVVSTAMTLSAFGGFAMTSASADEGDTSPAETKVISWFASVADGTPTGGNPGEETASIAADATFMNGALVSMNSGNYKTLPDIATKFSDVSGEAITVPEGLIGRLTPDKGTVVPDRAFKFKAPADGVLDVYVKVSNNKSFYIMPVDDYEALDKAVNAPWDNTTGSSQYKKISGPVKANTEYYLYSKGAGIDMFGVVFNEGAEYVPPVVATKAPATLKPVDPNSKSWTVSADDVGRKAGDMLMGGLTLVSDNTGTNKYVTAADNGKIETTEDGKIAAGSALKFVAPSDGKLEVTMIDCGGTNADGSVKSVTPVIYGVTEKTNLFEYTTVTPKEKVELSADVTAGNTYYITATGTKGRFSAAKFTPAGGEETSAPDTTTAPDVTTAPLAEDIKYENGTVTVTLDDTTVARGVLLHAKYKADKTLDSVESAPLTFTEGVAALPAADLEKTIENGDKLMVWDSLEGMKPLCPSAVVGGASATNPPATQAPNPSEGDTVDTTPNPVPVTENVITVDASKETNAEAKTYKTVTEALEAAKAMNGHASEADRITMNIVPGTYREQINVDVPYLTMKKAEGTTGDVLLTWYYGIGYQYYSTGSDGYYSKSAYETNKAAGTVAARGVDAWGCATRINASDFYAKDIIFENSFNRYMTEEEIADGVTPAEPKGAAYSDGVGKKPERTVGSNVYNGDFIERAAAIAIDNNNAERVAFYNCQFLSNQDTLYTGSKSNRIYFRDCVIEGQTDYIFGGNTCVFDNCDFNWAGFGSSPKGGHITAVKNASTPKGYLLYGGSVNAASTQGGQFVVGDLGRPWGGNDSPTAAIGVKINNLPNGNPSIAASGWANWSTPAKESQYYEYGTLDASGNKIDLSGRNALVPNEWDMLAFNPYRYLIKDGDNWDPMNVKPVWEPVIAKLGEVVIPDSETIKKTADTYEVSGKFNLPANPEGYELHFKSNSDYLVVNADNTVTAVRPVSGTSEATLTVYIRKSDNTYVGASKTINLTITADSSVDATVFTASMDAAKSAITNLMGAEASAVLDRAVPVPSVDEQNGVVTTIKLANEGSVNADGTIVRNPYESDAAKGKVTYIIECKKGETLLRDTVAYDVTIPSKKGDLLYADFEDNTTAVGGSVKKDGSNSGYYVNGAINAAFAKASSKSPVTVEFDVKKADTTVTVGKYTKTVAADAMQDGWNKVKLVIDTTAKTMTTSVNGIALGEAEAVAEGEASVAKLVLSAGDYDNITVFEGENNADGSKVYTTFWKASAADKGKTKDTVIMRGMTLMADMGSGSETSAVIDGETFNYYITGADNGGWTNGIAKDGGVGLKFVAPADGTWTVYLVDLGSNKTFYLGSPDKEVKADGTQGAKHALSIEVKGGMTYYATVAGSKGRFVGSKYVPTTEGGPKYEPEKPIENALNIEVSFVGQSAYKYYNTTEAIAEGTKANFSLDKDGNIVAADAENAVAKFENVNYHSADHGVNGGTITVQVPGYTKVTVGGCAWGADIVLKKGSDEIDRAANSGKCYHSDNSAVSFVYYKTNEPAELTLPINGYWPYVKIESITEAEVPNEVTASYTLGDAQGTAPDEQKVRVGKTITIPENRTVYKEGYTLTGWSDGTNTYTIGQTVTINNNMTLTPVFTENTKELANTSVTFDFQRQNGAPNIAGWQNAADNIWVGQATVDGTKMDVKMNIDTTAGKFANANWTDWAQINTDTKLTVPVLKGSVITFVAYGDDTQYKIGDDVFNRTDAASEPKSYTAAAAGNAVMVNIGGNYTRSITVTYPEATEPVEPTTQPTTAPTQTPESEKDVTVSGTVSLTGIYKNANNKIDNYKMKSSDLVLKLTPAAGEAVTATVTGVQDGEGDNALSYTATVKSGKEYTVSLSDTETNVYSVTAGGTVTPADNTVNNITAVKTYTYQVPLTIGAGALAKLNADNVSKLYIVFTRGIRPIEINVADITAGEKYTATGHSMAALDIDGSSNNWAQAILSKESASVSVPAGLNAAQSNQDSMDATGTINPVVKFQDVNASLLVSGITLTPVEAEGVWELKNDKVAIHPDNTLTVNAGIVPTNADNKNLTWSAEAVTANATGVSVSGGTVTVAADATGGSEWTIKATAQDGSNVNGTLTLQVVDASNSLGNVSITEADKAVTQVLPGKTVTATVSAKDGVDTTALTYKWLSAAKGSEAFTEIDGATASTYTIPADMAEKSTLKVVVSASGYDDAEATVEVTNLPVFTVDSFTTSGLSERGAWTISESQAKTYSDMGSPLGDLNQYKKYIDDPANTTVTIPETGAYKLYMLFREYSNRGYAATFTKDGAEPVKAVCLENMPKVATAGGTNYTVSYTDVTLDSGTYTVSFDRKNTATGGKGDGTQFMAFVLVKVEK